MKIKIFKPALLTLACVLALSWAKAQKITDSIKQVEFKAVEPLNVYALSNAVSVPMVMDMFVPQDSASRKEYRKLEEQMNELRKKMSKLRSESYKKNFRDSLKNKIKNYSYNYSYKFPDIKGDIQKSLDKSFEGLEKLNYTYSDNVSGASKGLGVTGTASYYNGDKGNDYLRRKIASGEVKEKVKNYTKTYPVNKDDKISIENIFGRITVNTWPKNEVKVDVQIKADADNDEKAQTLLDAITVADSKTDDVISFRTKFDEREDSETHYGVHKSEVNYTIYMPAKNQLQIKNRFGGVRLPNLTGKIMLNLSNGSLIAQQLTNPLNNLSIKFGDATIESLNSNSLNLSYGRLNVGTADNLNAKLTGATSNVSNLNTSGDITVRYGNGIKIGKLSNVKNLNVDAAFTKVLVNVNDDYNFDVNTRLGSFDYDDNKAVKVTDVSPETGHGSSTKTYKGKIGKGSNVKTITITSKLSGVKFDDAKH